jgi:signal transduction histidine kinase/ligand-binding sensor domain-containing protein/DNA-binding response OmpR family regulator
MTSLSLIRTLWLLAIIAGPVATSAAGPNPAMPDLANLRPVFTHLTVDDGLPENTVRTIIQDRLGFLWLGTQSGVARYDGYQMATPWHRKDGPGSVPRVMAVALLEGTDGAIWIGSVLNGLWRLDPRTEQGVQVVAPGKQADGREVGVITGLAEDGQGRIWVASTGSGLCRIDPATMLVTWAGDHPELPAPGSADLNDVFVDRHDRVWAASSDAGGFVREPDGERWVNHRHDPDRPDGLPSDSVTDVIEGPGGRIWLATIRGLASWLPQRRAFQAVVPQPDGLPMYNYCMQLAPDGGDGLWVASAVGLYHHDPTSGRFRLFAHQADDPRSPVKGPVLSVLRDRAGVVWAGSWHAGLNKLDPVAQKFSYLAHDPADPGSLDDDAVAAILEGADGTLWVGTGSMATGGSTGALNELAPGATVFRHHAFAVTEGQPVRTVQALAEDRDGRLWLGTNLGLWALDRATGDPVRMHRDPEGAAGIADMPVRNLFVDSHGDLWVGVVGQGLYRIDQVSGRVDRFQTGAGSSPLGTPVAVFEDTAGRLWIGTDSQGLYRFDRRSASLERYFDPRVGLSSVIDIHQDGAGRLWLGTYGGLLQFDPDAGAVVRTVGSDEGLPHGVVASILEDDQGGLWLSTGRGLCRFDPESAEVSSYDARDGLPGNDLAFAHERRRDGTLVFGNTGGLMPFRPASIVPRRDDPRVVITGLSLGGEPAGPSSSPLVAAAAPYLDRLVLPHDRNDLAISFATLHLAQPERHRYRYRLAGNDGGWRDAVHQRVATYTNLAPGRYRFEVQGTNGDGIWSRDVAGLDLEVTPPWWLTAWARGGLMLLIGLLALAVYRQVVNRERMHAALAVQRSEALKLQELDRFKTRFFANITHEFRTPLTLLRGPVQRLREDPASGDPELFAMMARNTERLGQLIDQLLDLARLDARSLPLRFAEADCVGFLRTVTASFASLAESRNLRFAVELPDAPLRCWFDADLFEKVVGNLLTNAMKFAPAGEAVTLTLTAAADVAPHPVPGLAHAVGPPEQAPARPLRLTVANTGSFIPEAELGRIFDRFHQLGDGQQASGSGIGLALVRELVEWHGGTVTAASDPRTGTCFTVTLPVFLERPVPDTVDAVAADPLPSSATPPADAPVVLIVEDSDDLRAYLARELSPTYQLLVAADGAAGLALALAEIPDLVVSDVMMPAMDGFELCQALREDQRTSHVPIILLTALAEVEKRREGLRHGADAYLAKPFDVEELGIRIENLIDQRRRLAALYAGRVTDLPTAAMPVISADDRFLQRAREAVENHLDDEDLQVEDLCREVGLSRSQFHRKLKALTGQSATGFIRAHRLQRAADLLAGGYGNVTEVAYAVGFQSLSYFARCFREQYGVPPSEYPGRATDATGRRDDGP